MKYKVFRAKDDRYYYYKDEQGKIVSGPYYRAYDFDEYGVALIDDLYEKFYFINEKFERKNNCINGSFFIF